MGGSKGREVQSSVREVWLHTAPSQSEIFVECNLVNGIKKKQLVIWCYVKNCMFEHIIIKYFLLTRNLQTVYFGNPWPPPLKWRCYSRFCRSEMDKNGRRQFMNIYEMARPHPLSPSVARQQLSWQRLMTARRKPEITVRMRAENS